MNSTALVILCLFAIPGTKKILEKTVFISKGVVNAYRIACDKVDFDPDED